MLHVITYATHSDGTFELLLEDAKLYNIDVVVLGWGTPWTGFFDKVRAFIDFSSKCAPDDVIIFLDGFDTRITRDPRDAVEAWKTEFGDCMLASKNSPIFNNKYLDYYINLRIFRGEINSGMFIGAAKDVHMIWKAALLHGDACHDDDQCALNMTRHMKLKIDCQERIFKNVPYHERGKDHAYNACFQSFPGTLSVARCMRAMREYTPIVWKEAFVLILLITACVCFIRSRKR